MIRLTAALALALALASSAAAQDAGADRETAVFAGGCFWCVEADFDKVEGVRETISGYAGGDVANPSYAQVVAGGTGHREAVKVVYDPEAVSYDRLLDIFFRTVDPTDGGGQFCDRGFSYTTAVYVEGEDQRAAAEAAKSEAAGTLGREIATEISASDVFYPAEDYHQDYYEKNPVSYRFYRWRCGRDARIEELWGEGPEQALDRLG